MFLVLWRQRYGKGRGNPKQITKFLSSRGPREAARALSPSCREGTHAGGIARKPERFAWTCDGIRDTYHRESTCQGTVPQAIVAFLDGTDFEDCVRNAISIGGDSDTPGCITGSIAEAFYGVPEALRGKAMDYLSEDFRRTLLAFEEKHGCGPHASWP